MIKITERDSNLIIWVPLSKIAGIVETSDGVVVGGTNGQSVEVAESIHEIQSRIDEVLRSGKAF